MIARARKVRRKHRKSPAAWHAAFLTMLPAIQEQARYAFRRLDAEAKEDAVQEIVCAACTAFARLVSQGKAHVASPSALTRFAVRQYRSGRRVGCKLNIKDVSSPYCQMQKRLTLKRLDRRDPDTNQWEEILLEDRRAGPADTAAARLDVREWFQRMGPRDRCIAQALAVGERTRDVAKRFGVSCSRISQKRLEFCSSWNDFQSDDRGAGTAA